LGKVSKLNTFTEEKKNRKQKDFLDVKNYSLLLLQLTLSAPRQVDTQPLAGLILFVDNQHFK